MLFNFFKKKVKQMEVEEEDQLDFEFEVVSGNTAVQMILKNREEKTEGLKVILGDQESFQNLSDVIEENEEKVETILNASNNFILENFLLSRADEEYDYDELIGEWTSGKPAPFQPIAHTNILNGKPLKEVYVGNIQTSLPYEIPAFLKYGDWNDCPKPEEHVGIHKYWYEKYGAEIISITSDTMECLVKNPPKTKEEAYELAREQFLYCPDLVLQGVETISGLAETVIKSNFWFFWWD